MNLFKPQASAIIKNRPHVVYLLVDCSTSMAGDALDQARQGALSFAADARLRGYSVGLIRFADTANALLNPDTGFTLAIADLTAFGNTNLTAAIQLATERLATEASGQRTMCIVTDGMPDNPRSALKAAKLATHANIQIMAIGTSGADLKFLSKLATTSQLANYVATAQLGQGLTEMAKMLPRPR